MSCRACSLRFLHPQPTPEELERLYGSTYFSNQAPGSPGYDRYVEEIEHHRLTFADRLQLLPAPGREASLLDIGASIGIFVEQARRVGWEAEGVEPSAWAAEYARKTLGQPVRTGRLEDQGLPPGRHDVITMWEVIEHLPDPALVLDEIHRLLKPGGILALSTPDAGSLVTRLLGHRWPGWKKVPEHLFFFDRRTLRTLLRRTGFDPFFWRTVPLTVSRRYLYDRLAQVVPLPAPRWLPESWMQRPIRVNPGYDLMVMARRS